MAQVALKGLQGGRTLATGSRNIHALTAGKDVHLCAPPGEIQMMLRGCISYGAQLSASYVILYILGWGCMQGSLSRALLI